MTFYGAWISDGCLPLVRPGRTGGREDNVRRRCQLFTYNHRQDGRWGREDLVGGRKCSGLTFYPFVPPSTSQPHPITS